jgi:hypothetical protein
MNTIPFLRHSFLYWFSVTWRYYLNCNSSISEWNLRRLWLQYCRLPWPTHAVLISNPVWYNDEILTTARHLTSCFLVPTLEEKVRSKYRGVHNVLLVQRRQLLTISWRDYGQAVVLRHRCHDLLHCGYT